MDVAGLLQGLAYLAYAAIHHIGWSDHIRPGISVRERLPHKYRHRLVIHHIAVLIDKPILAVGADRRNVAALAVDDQVFLTQLAFALATAQAVLDDLRGKVDEADFPAMVGRISFFVNAGIRFVTEMCKMRAFNQLWDRICRERYGVDDPRYRRFRYGVQVNSLGLTEQQAENNVSRILLEMLAVVLSKDARARSVQLPACRTR